VGESGFTLVTAAENYQNDGKKRGSTEPGFFLIGVSYSTLSDPFEITKITFFVR
jgi:hypothetical protein